jgi:hypothetical protein
MKKEYILQEIKRTAETNGGAALGSRKFTKETGIREGDWLGKHWARWSDALREAGYAPNEMTTPYGESFLFQKFIELARELKKLPVKGDFLYKVRHDSSFPNSKTFERFGSKVELVKAVMEYCRTHEGYEDIIVLCEGHSPRHHVTKDQVEPAEGEIGFVYFMNLGYNFQKN